MAYFLRCRFGVHVDDHDWRMGAVFFENLIDAAKRIVDVIRHENTALQD